MLADTGLGVTAGVVGGGIMATVGGKRLLGGFTKNGHLLGPGKRFLLFGAGVGALGGLVDYLAQGDSNADTKGNIVKNALFTGGFAAVCGLASGAAINFKFPRPETALYGATLAFFTGAAAGAIFNSPFPGHSNNAWVRVPAGVLGGTALGAAAGYVLGFKSIGDTGQIIGHANMMKWAMPTLALAGGLYGLMNVGADKPAQHVAPPPPPPPPAPKPKPKPAPPQPEVLMSNNDSNRSVTLHSTKGTTVELWGEPHVEAILQSDIPRRFSIGYGHGSFNLSDGNQIDWDTYGPNGKHPYALKSVVVTAPQGQQTAAVTNDGADPQNMPTQLSDQDLQAFARYLKNHSGPFNQRLKGQ
jgi:hypothetical protein